MFKLSFSYLQNTLHLMQYTYQDVFSTAQNSVWTRQFWYLLVLLLFFVSSLLHRQNIFLWGLLSPGETKKKSPGARLGEWERSGKGVMLFLVKNCWTLSAMWADMLINHPSWNGQTSESLQNKYTAVEHSFSQQHLLVHDTDVFLEHSPSGGSLY